MAMTETTSDRTRFAGRYRGEGRWLDIAGESKPYHVVMQISAAREQLTVTYTHDFYEEGSATNGEFVFVFSSDVIFATTMKGAEVGNGYLFDDYLHFNIRAGDIFVETSYQITPVGLQVRGSSTRNAQGRFIGWHERLAPDVS